MIFETHAHYDDEAFDKDREELLRSLYDNQIGHIVNVGADIESSKNSVELAKKYDFMYAAVGVHPSEISGLKDKDLDWLKEQTKNSKVVAIGEIGLDYHEEEPDPKVQKEWFIKQLELAREVKLPVIIHSRDAANDTFEIMKHRKAEEIGGVVHCYSYSVEMARQYLNLGFYFGIGGVVTFKNGKKLKEVVRYLPIENIVLETDCPYLAPEPHRGTRNSSLNLTYVAKTIAELKAIEYEEVIRITEENAKKLYRLK